MTILHVESPQCSWLGEGRKVLIVDKDKRTFRFESPNPKEQKLNGVLSQLRVGLEGDACDFVIAGHLRNGCIIYRDSEKVQWLHNDYDREDPETDIHMWGCLEHKEWAKECVFNLDGTVSPKHNPQNVCLGVQKGNTGKIVFVPRSDKARRLVLKCEKLTFRQHIDMGLYTREAADNLFYGLPELRSLLDAGLISTAPGHPNNADYQIRSIAEVGTERSHAFVGNVPPFGYKYACTPKSNGAAVPFNDGWATTYHGPSRLCNVLGIASAGLRPCAPGASNFHPGCEGKIYVTPSVTVAWQAYSCQVTQEWHGKRQKWRLLFQCRADKSKAHVQPDTTSLAAARAGPAFNVDDPLSVDPHLRHDELEWVLKDATRVHVHGLCLIPFPWSHDPYHHHLEGCMAVLPQKSANVKATLTLHADAPPVTKAALKAALDAASKQLHCGCVVVSALVLNVDKPHAFLLFMSDLAARVAVDHFAHAGRSVHVEGFDVGLRLKHCKE